MTRDVLSWTSMVGGPVADAVPASAGVSTVRSMPVSGHRGRALIRRNRYAKSDSSRTGFTLLELITAMLASTVLLASLAATVVISTRLLEQPPDDRGVRHDRLIADRLAEDLRYATSINENLSAGFQLTKPNAVDGASETVIYESSIQGLTRRVDSGQPASLDSQAVSREFFVDGYSAPSDLTSSKFARVRSSSSAFTDDAVTAIDIEVPPGCRGDDLVILCVTAKNADSLDISGSDWRSLAHAQEGDLQMITTHRIYDATWSDIVQVTATPAATMTVAMLAIENASVSAPIDWAGTASGFAWDFLSWTHPQPLETSGFQAGQLNIQLFAAERDPWIDGAMGLAGFSDVMQITAAAGDIWMSHTMGITVRNGESPSLSTPPRLLHRSSGFWLQTAARVEVAP